MAAAAPAAAASAVASAPIKLPNILITGTPGTGKTTTAEMVAALTKLTHVNVGELIKAKELHDGVDKEFDSFILNEDKVVDELEQQMSGGGCVCDFHTCDFFPERWFDLVVVLRTDNSVLYPRLEARQYSAKKIEENITAEIMQTVRDSALESYDKSIVIELQSDTLQQMEENVERIGAWLQHHLKRQHQQRLEAAQTAAQLTKLVAGAGAAAGAAAGAQAVAAVGAAAAAAAGGGAAGGAAPMFGAPATAAGAGAAAKK